MWTETPLYKQLKIQPGVTAVVGSGGKTSLLRHLCQELPGTVILCTSTHIFPFIDVPVLHELSGCMPFPKLCLGTPTGSGKLTAPKERFSDLAQIAEYVLVEADGSKQLPLKAHLEYEPVIPSCANQVIQVIGLSGIGRTIQEAAHRPERFAQLCGRTISDTVGPRELSLVLNKEALADRYVLNQTDQPAAFTVGSQLAALLNRPCFLTALHPSEGIQQN